MLLELSIQNIVLVSQARIEPGVGFTVISGETGAGKSLLMESLGLLSGARAAAGLIGPKGPEAVVAAVFSCSKPLAECLSTLTGLSIEAGELVLRRKLSAGRSQAWIQDAPVSLHALENVWRHLVESRSQDERLAFADPVWQMTVLDRYGKHQALTQEYAEVHAKVEELQTALSRLKNAERGSVRELEQVRWELQAIDELNPQAGEFASLEARHSLLAHAQEWKELSQEVATTLLDGETPLAQTAGQLAKRLSEAPDPRLKRAAEACLEAQELLREAGLCANAAFEGIGCDGQELQSIANRLNSYQDLLRRFGPTEEELLAQRQSLQNRVEELSNLDTHIAQAQETLVQAQKERKTVGEKLAKVRRAAAKDLIAAVERELSDLGMPRARLSLHEDPAIAPTVHAFLHQEIWIATNPGLPAGPIHQVASGGEASRLLLALSVVLAEVLDLPVMVFDEIDSGVGARLGEVLAEKLCRLARGRSVLAVTHTAQIAARADRHYAVVKQQEETATSVQVLPLEGSARTAEIAAMLGGGALAIEQAQAMMGHRATAQNRARKGS